MSNLTFVDAAYAGAITGTYDGVCFYLPGGDAYHPWPLADLQARPERYRLPVWVRSNPDAANPVTDAEECLIQLAAYGVPRGALVALDSETSIAPSWVGVFVNRLNDASHPVIDYGSQSTVFGNYNLDGYYWGADWTDVEHLASGDDMTQYAHYSNQDIDTASPKLPFWDTRPATPPMQWTEFDAMKLPVLAQGAADKPGGGFWYVHRLQTLANLTWELTPASGTMLTVDGQYGPATATLIRAIQAHYKITVDGIAGPQTWGVLLTGSPG